jgi:hypothetical protein
MLNHFAICKQELLIFLMMVICVDLEGSFFVELCRMSQNFAEVFSAKQKKKYIKINPALCF